MWKEWVIAVDHIEDPQAVFELGHRAYKEFMGEHLRDSDSESLEALKALSRLLDLAFVEIDADALFEIKRSLEGYREFTEPAILENVCHSARIHWMIEEERNARRDPILLELMMQAHDIENVIRPNLCRLYWALGRANLRPLEYSKAQTKKGQVVSIGCAITQIEKALWKGRPCLLDEDDFLTIRKFVTGLINEEKERIGLDRLRNWISHRNFVILEDAVLMPVNLRNGKSVKGNRNVVPFDLIRENFLKIRGLTVFMFSFQTMFLVHIVARSGDIRPSLFGSGP